MISINSRVLSGAITIVIGFTVLTGLTLDKAFYNSALSALQERLTGQAYLLMADTEITVNGQVRLPDRLSIEDLNLPSSATSARITQADGKILWQSLSDLKQSYPPLEQLDSGNRIFQFFSSNGDKRFIISFAVVWKLAQKDHPLVFQLSDNLKTFNQQMAAYRHSLWSYLTLMAIILLVTLTIILRWGLKPLRDVAIEVNSVEKGSQNTINRIYPEELKPLTNSINKLIEHERHQQQRYRNALGDLAHSLKTPLAIIKSEPFEKLQPEKYIHNVDDAVSRIDTIVEYQLQRASLVGSESHLPLLKLFPVTQQIVNSLKKIYPDKIIDFQINMDKDIQYRTDEGDLMELFGNLLDNASKWCKQKIILTTMIHHNKLIIDIEDDGSGIAEETRQKILMRGVRADELTPGHGVGLAIVGDIVESYHGKIKISSSATLGGAKISLDLPVLVS